MPRSSLGFTAQTAKLRKELIHDCGFTGRPTCPKCGRQCNPECIGRSGHCLNCEQNAVSPEAVEYVDGRHD